MAGLSVSRWVTSATFVTLLKLNARSASQSAGQLHLLRSMGIRMWMKMGTAARLIKTRRPDNHKLL